MYDVLISPAAKADLDEIIRYIVLELENPVAAQTLSDKVDERLSDLEEMPGKFPFCKDPILRAQGYHAVTANDYVLIYRILEDCDTVWIVHIYHTLQNYEDQLLRYL